MNPETGYTTMGQRDVMAKTSTTSCGTPASTYVGYAASAPPPTHLPGTKPTDPIQRAGDELKWLDQELGTLHAQLDILEQRLEAVLTPPGPDGDGKAVCEGFASPLVLKIRDDRDLLDRVNRRLGRLIDRIEL